MYGCGELLFTPIFYRVFSTFGFLIFLCLDILDMVFLVETIFDASPSSQLNAILESEGCVKSKAELLEEMGVDTDEDMAVKMPGSGA